MFALFSPNNTYDGVFLANYAVININDLMTRVKGIASVSVFGAGNYAMRLWVRPDRLAQMGVTVPEIINAIQAQNTVNPAGQIGGEPIPPGQQYTYAVRAQGRLETAEQFENIVIRADPGGSILRVKDVARVELGAQNYNMKARLNGRPCAAIALYQLPDSNAVDAANGAKAVMEKLKQSFPPDMDYVVALDTTLAVTAGMKEIEHTLVEAIILVIIVVFIFLQGWRATLIPLLAVPVSLVGTFALFPLFGFSINTLSLFGLVLAIGLVVDDAIVVVEIVEHHIEKGLSPKDAALKGMQEVAGPVVAIAIILTAVFLPTAFIPGITGRLYQQFAVTIAVSVAISAFNALTLVTCARGVAAPAQGQRHRPAPEILRCVQQRIRPGDRWLCRDVPPADSQKRLHDDFAAGLSGAGRDHGQIGSHQLSARRGSGLRVRRHPIARRLVRAAHERGDGAGGGDSQSIRRA